MAEHRVRKVAAPVAAAVGIVGTMASIWWFALKPRRKAKHAGTTAPMAEGPAENGPAASESD